MLRTIIRNLAVAGLLAIAPLASATKITLFQATGSNVTTDGIDNEIYYGAGANAATCWGALMTELTTDAAIDTVVIQDGIYNLTSVGAVQAIINKSVTFRGTTNSASDNVQLNFTIGTAVTPVITVGQATGSTANNAITLNNLKILFTTGNNASAITALINAIQATTGNTFQTAVTINTCTLATACSSNTSSADVAVIGYTRATGDTSTIGTPSTQFALTINGGTYTYGNPKTNGGILIGLTPGDTRGNSHMRVNVSNATLNSWSGNGIFMPGRGGDDVGVSVTGCTFKIANTANNAVAALIWVCNNAARLVTNSNVTFTDNKVYVAGNTAQSSVGAGGTGQTSGVNLFLNYAGATASAADTNNLITIARNYIDTKVGGSANGTSGIIMQAGFPGNTTLTGSNKVEASVKIYNNVLVSSGGNASGGTVGTATNANNAQSVTGIRLIGGINADIYHNTIVYDNGRINNPTYHGYSAILLNLPLVGRGTVPYVTNVKDNLIYNFAGSTALVASTYNIYTDGVVATSGIANAGATAIATDIDPITANKNMLIGPITSAKLANNIIYTDSAAAGAPVVGTDLGGYTEVNYALGAATGTWNGTVTIPTTPVTSVPIVAPNAKVGTYTATALTAGVSPIFLVTDPDGIALGTVVAAASPGTVFFNQIGFNVVTGTIASTIGDTRTFIVSSSVDSTYNNDYANTWKNLATGASAGGINTADSFVSDGAVGTTIGGKDLNNANRNDGLGTGPNFDIGAYQLNLTPVELSGFSAE